jgi:thiamine biosynthesis lipoprotein
MTHDGPAHHLIDPRSGNPAMTPIISATVIAATAVEAEAGAKAVLIRGATGLAWAAATSWIRSAVAVWHDGNVYATPGVEVAA